jgi:tetratricopeptide (TPR) repeat protein
VSRELGDEQLTGVALQNLGSAMFELGDVAAARVLQEEALDVLRRTGNKFGVITNLINLGEVTYLQGDFAAARAYFGEGLTLVREVGTKKQLALSLDGFAALAAKRGEWRRAARLAGAADALREASGYRLQPTSRVFRDRYEAEVRAALGEEEFSAALAEGRAMRRSEAVSFALKTASA